MRDVDVETITGAVRQAWDKTPDARLKYVLENLVDHLHAFARNVQLTHEEWLEALNFIARCGDISDAQRNEFALLSDVFGLTSLTDLINSKTHATAGSVLGPFYAAGSHYVAREADLVGQNAGEIVLVCGVVKATNGSPLQHASIDLWQTNAQGLYATQDPLQPDDNFRCRQECDATGRYWFTTVLPAPYTIPTDGPVGDLFRATLRSPWRPAHFHFIVRAPGYRPIVTEVFLADDKFLSSDAVFGVREELIRKVADDLDQLPVPLDRVPAKRIDFDFVLVPLD
jgi:hydroxyquinol 1,2-dioxygenase